MRGGRAFGPGALDGGILASPLSRPLSRGALVGGAVAGACAVAGHFTPALASIPKLRSSFAPALSGIGSEGHVALTFDDGPDPASTPEVLAALERLGWRATFFMLGSMADAAPSLAREVVAAGHEVAVHGYAHRNQLLLPPGEVRDDVARGLDAVGRAAGCNPVWFRPPYGVLSWATLSATRLLGLRPVLWSAWGRDWRASATPESVAAEVRRGMVDGGTVLLHDSDCTSAPGAWRSACEALPVLAEGFNEEGLRAGPLAEHGIAI